jgi:hypothetical protein
MKDIAKLQEKKERPASLYDYDEDFWRKRFSSEPHAREGDTFEDFAPAYRYGVLLRTEYREFHLNEAAIRERWDAEKGDSRLSWERAREPVKIAWFQDREFAEAKPEELFTPGRES